MKERLQITNQSGNFLKSRKLLGPYPNFLNSLKEANSYEHNGIVGQTGAPKVKWLDLKKK